MTGNCQCSSERNCVQTGSAVRIRWPRSYQSAHVSTSGTLRLKLASGARGSQSANQSRSPSAIMCLTPSPISLRSTRMRPDSHTRRSASPSMIDWLRDSFSPTSTPREARCSVTSSTPAARNSSTNCGLAGLSTTDSTRRDGRAAATRNTSHAVVGPPNGWDIHSRPTTFRHTGLCCMWLSNARYRTFLSLYAPNCSHTAFHGGSQTPHCSHL